MRVTKVMLEQEVVNLKLQKKSLYKEVCLLKEKVRILSLPIRGNETLTIALERSTEAVAHVLTDIRQIYRR